MAINSIRATTVAVITTQAIQVQQLEWSGAGSAGDGLVLVDNNGRDVWRATAPGTDYDLFKTYGKPAVIQGLNVTTIGSGTLTIYYV